MGTNKWNVEILLLGVFLMMVFCGSLVRGDDATLEKECATLMTKMTNCLGFATGKSDAPTKECCTSVTEVKDSNPACLCFFIQQIHKGDANLKSLGLQEARLLQLPTVCKLTNASVSECPKLLNLPANSPDVAIFKQSASNASSSSTTATPQSGTTPASTSPSSAFKNTQQLAGPVVLAIVSIFIFAFSSGIVLFS